MGLPIVEGAQMPASDPHEDEKAQVHRNLAGVKRVVAIHSGKGGVGKTFLSANIALALAHQGLKVGLFDADIDCPNVAKFFNLRALPLEGTAQGRINPLDYRGMKVVSAHFLTDDPTLPMIVRGPIKHKVMAQLLTQVEWGDLDALIVDLPPGTADVPMSSMMIGRLDGIIVVTTPQKESVMDARKSALMAKDLGVPVLGIVENMSGEVFGEGSGARLAEEMGVPMLASIPLSKDIRVLNEKGRGALIEHDGLRGLASPIVASVLGRPVTLKKKRMKTLFRW